jgi:segregation and condensation protein B
MENKQLKFVIEAALLAAGRPLTVDRIQELFGKDDPPVRQDLRAAIMELKADYADRGIEVAEVASGFRIQIRSAMAHQLEHLWDERPPRYSRALLETLSIVAYRQPVTRGEIEEIRGVAVSTNIVRTLLERNWVRVVGHRDVPGKPAMFGTTKEFLDYFDLKKLDDLPPLAELKDFERLNIQLDLPDGDVGESPVGPDDVETDNVASIEDARAAAASQAAEAEVEDYPDAEVVDEAVLPDDESPVATILPLKQT